MSNAYHICADGCPDPSDGLDADMGSLNLNRMAFVQSKKRQTGLIVTQTGADTGLSFVSNTICKKISYLIVIKRGLLFSQKSSMQSLRADTETIWARLFISFVWALNWLCHPGLIEPPILI